MVNECAAVQEEASFTASMISCLAAAGPAMPPTPSTKPLMASLQNLRRAPSLVSISLLPLF